MQRAANEMCLARLKDRGLVELMPAIVTPASGVWERREVNILTRQGSDRVRAWHKAEGAPWAQRSAGTVRDYRWATINELYWIIDAATAIVAGAEREDIALVEWLDKFDAAGKGRGKPGDKRKETPFPFVEPDGYLLLRRDGVGIPLFLESDRDTEPVESRSPNAWVRKIERYGELLRWWHRTYPHNVQPLVLTVTTTALRLKNLRTATETLGGRDAYWFTTEDALATPKDLALPFPDALGPIWAVPHNDTPHSLRDHLTRPRRRAA